MISFVKFRYYMICLKSVGHKKQTYIIVNILNQEYDVTIYKLMQSEECSLHTTTQFVTCYLSSNHSIIVKIYKK